MLAPRFTPRCTIFDLPPSLRAKAYRTTLRRPFSASPLRFEATTLATVLRSVVTPDLTAAAIALPNYLLTTLHATGLPWYAAIPVSALLVRSTFTYFVATRRNRAQTQRAAHLQPLINARLMQDERVLADLERSTNIRPSRSNRSFMGLKLVRWWRVSGAVVKPWGLPVHPLLAPSRWVNFGLLLAFSETIRRLCGTREGLLPLLLGPFERVARWVVDFQPDMRADREVAAARASAQAATPPTAHNDPELVSGSLGADSSSLHEAASAAASAGGAKPSGALPYYDLTLHTEGLRFCTDLTLPDPSLLLPALLSLSFAASILLAPRIARPRPRPPAAAAAPPDETPQKHAHRPESALTTNLSNLQRLALALSIPLFFVALRFPAALLLYYLPSLWLGVAHTRWLNLRAPVRPAPARCARAVRQRGWGKEWSGLD